MYSNVSNKGERDFWRDFSRIGWVKLATLDSFRVNFKVEGVFIQILES